MSLAFDWSLRTRVVFGPGRLAELPGLVEELGARRVLLVTGSRSMHESGGKARTLEVLAGFEVKVHSGVRVNLPLEDVDELLEATREFGPEAVIALGGGSALDGAKAAALIAPQGGGIRDYLEGRPAGPGLPFIAIPTTAGTGSEVTPFMILLDAQAKRKRSLGPRTAQPAAAVVDPELCLSLPALQTAATGLDAISHCLESYWSKRANPLSDALALSALPVLLANLEPAVRDPDDLEARTGMSYGALAAGMALAQTATAAVHGLTYPLTAHFGVTHGIACAFMLCEVLKINFHHLPRSKQTRLLHHLNCNTLGAALDRLTELFSALSVPMTLAELGVPESAIELFADEVNPLHLERNLAPLSRDKILELWAMKKER